MSGKGGDAESNVVIIDWNAENNTLSWIWFNNGHGGALHQHVLNPSSVPDVDAQCSAVPLPRLGEMEIADGDCALDLSGPPARQCHVRWLNGKAKLTEPGTGREAAVISADKMRLPADAAREGLKDKIGDYFLVDAGLDPPGCWLEETEGARDAFISRNEARKAAAAARKAAEKQREDDEAKQEHNNRRFINPYTFVPFPTAIQQETPAGHHCLAPGRFSGRLTARWELTSPMQAPQTAQDGQRLRLAGSSIKGVLRSLHETLAGGCLRVLDEDFLPTYRDPAVTSENTWTLGIVSDVTLDGQPLAVRSADKVVWVEHNELPSGPPLLHSGDRITINETDAQSGTFGRSELIPRSTVTRGGDWVVFFSGPRPPATARGKGEPRYFVACGRISEDRQPIEVREEAWSAYRNAVGNARDVVEARRKASENSDAYAPVTFRHKTIGKRRRVASRLKVDDVLWVLPDAAGKVVGLKAANLWRHQGTGTLRERVPEHLLSCHDETNLCPTCRLFGSADTRPASRRGCDDGGSRGAEQRSYAGHVRLGDAVSEKPVTLTKTLRAPMGMPRPGAGQFYLAYDDRGKNPAGNERELPTREWGSKPDKPKPRPVRGRKFYWHADPTRQEPPRHKARGHQEEGTMATPAFLVGAGTVFAQTITFDNLSAAEVGSLLATLEPHRVLDPARGPFRLHLGGAKPLGLGSCTATITDMQIWTAQSRYAEAPAATLDFGQATAEFVDSCRDEVKSTWPAVSAVLSDGLENAERVWYPPGLHWSEQNGNPKEFDSPFAFFRATSGEFVKNGEKKYLRPLPEPTATDQRLSIVSRKRQSEEGKR